MNSLRRTLLIVALLCPFMALGGTASMAETKLEATIFSFDGKDFVRTATTLNAEGESAVNTKLEEGSPAFDALINKHSYSGATILFGKDYHANYAPLISADGKLTGAVFVGVPK